MHYIISKGGVKLICVAPVCLQFEITPSGKIGYDSLNSPAA
jgi:hypothetical protein